MILWKKVNPLSSLFGRIFLWFWLTSVFLVATTWWLADQIRSETQISAIDPQSSQNLSQLANRISRLSVAYGEDALDDALQQIDRELRQPMVLVDRETGKYFYSFPRPPMEEREKTYLDPLLKLSEPVAINWEFGQFVGPKRLTLFNKDFVLFVGRPMPPGGIREIHRQHPVLLISLAIIISASLCFWLAWSLLRPIREVQRAAIFMSEGDLSARADKASLRADEIGELSRAFNRMSEQVERLLNSQKRLLADISHELRSPLARLQVAIGIAQQQSEMELSQVSRIQLDRIEKEAQQIEQMIAQVLRLSRLEAQQLTIEKEEFSLSSVVNAIISDARFEASSLNKRVEGKVSSELVYQGDPQLIASAIENVLRNAIKYAYTKVDISVEADEKNISVRIRDDGAGLPDDELAHIFTPFYRLSSSRTRDTGGVGLGLAIAQQSVALHSGEISASNIASGGLDVVIRLPQTSASSTSKD